MAKTASKNARAGTSTQRFFCPCGGEIKMVGRMVSSKVRWFAICEKCKTEKRRPSDFE